MVGIGQIVLKVFCFENSGSKMKGKNCTSHLPLVSFSLIPSPPNTLKLKYNSVKSEYTYIQTLSTIINTEKVSQILSTWNLLLKILTQGSKVKRFAILKNSSQDISFFKSEYMNKRKN
jgi:hypothetical protein